MQTSPCDASHQRQCVDSLARFASLDEPRSARDNRLARTSCPITAPCVLRRSCRHGKVWLGYRAGKIMYSVSSCLVCNSVKRTIVAEYNRLIAIESLCGSDLARSDYALCHGCGLVYATLRPDRAEYDYMYENFNELTLRENKTQQNIFILPDELDAAMRAELDRGFVPWWELRTAEVEEGDRVRGPMLREFDSTLSDLPDLLLHLDFAGAHVLQIRAKTGQFADFLMRALGARSVDLMTLFPAHTYMALKYPGVRAAAGLDYETFHIPFDEQYDIIIENHALTHMLSANDTFEEFRRHIRDDGALYVKNELDDARLFAKGNNMFAELRSFHFQQFDIPTLSRMLATYGFAPLGLRHPHHRKALMAGVARKEPISPAQAPRIPSGELKARLAMYRRWRDESVLSLPRELAGALFGAELKSMRKRVTAAGGMARDRKGRLPALRVLKFDDQPDGLAGTSALEAMAA